MLCILLCITDKKKRITFALRRKFHTFSSIALVLAKVHSIQQGDAKVNKSFHAFARVLPHEVNTQSFFMPGKSDCPPLMAVPVEEQNS